MIAANPVYGQGQISIGSSSRLDTGSGFIDLGCASLKIDGLITGRWLGIDDLETGTHAQLETEMLAFGGNWTSLLPMDVSGQTRWQDQCGRTDGTLLGYNRFESFTITASDAVTRYFDVGSEQTVYRSLELRGVSAPLTLRSTSESQPARLTVMPSAIWSIFGVDVANIDSSGGQGLAPGAPENYQSVDSGGNINWFLKTTAIPIPLLGWTGKLLMLSILLALGCWRLTTTPLSRTN